MMPEKFTVSILTCSLTEKLTTDGLNSFFILTCIVLTQEYSCSFVSMTIAWFWNTWLGISCIHVNWTYNPNKQPKPYSTIFRFKYKWLCAVYSIYYTWCLNGWGQPPLEGNCVNKKQQYSWPFSLIEFLYPSLVTNCRLVMWLFLPALYCM